MNDDTAPDLILHSGHIVTLDPSNPTANTLAISAGRFTRVGTANEITMLKHGLALVMLAGLAQAMVGLALSTLIVTESELVA